MIRTILSRYVSSNFWSRGTTFFFTIFPAFILAATALPACGGGTASGSDRTLAVTIEPQKYFIESIADKSVQVVALVPAGTNPEEYDPSPTVMKRLSEADAYFYKKVVFSPLPSRPNLCRIKVVTRGGGHDGYY